MFEATSFCVVSVNCVITFVGIGPIGKSKWVIGIMSVVSVILVVGVLQLLGYSIEVIMAIEVISA